MAGRQRRELFRPLAKKGTGADQHRTNTLLGKSCKGWFEIAFGSRIHNNELPTQRERRGLEGCNDGVGGWIGWVRQNAETGGSGTQVAEQLQPLRLQLSL